MKNKKEKLISIILLVILFLILTCCYFKIKNSVTQDDNNLSTELNTDEQLDINVDNENVDNENVDNEIVNEVKTDEVEDEQSDIISEEQPDKIYVEQTNKSIDNSISIIKPENQPQIPVVDNSASNNQSINNTNESQIENHVNLNNNTEISNNNEINSCKSKKFINNWFRADFSSLEECQAEGVQYINNYTYACDNLMDECKVRYYMLKLFDENGIQHDYRITPKDNENTQ